MGEFTPGGLDGPAGPAGAMDYETHHRVAVARELAAVSGVPLRDRYGFAASDEDVRFVVDLLFREPDDFKARDLIGAANGTDIELAMAPDVVTSPARNMAVVRALRPLFEQRRAAAARGLRA
jgi:hypothetical protein